MLNHKKEMTKIMEDLVNVVAPSILKITDNNNPNRKYTYEYSSNRNYVLKKSEKITEVIMWIVFFLTLPLIWFTRDFSIHIVNFSVSLVSKGWKKL